MCNEHKSSKNNQGGDSVTQEKSKDLLTPKDVLKEYPFGRSTLYDNLLKRKDFPSFKIGTKIYIPRKKLEEWFEAQCK